MKIKGFHNHLLLLLINCFHVHWKRIIIKVIDWIILWKSVNLSSWNRRAPSGNDNETRNPFALHIAGTYSGGDIRSKVYITWCAVDCTLAFQARRLFWAAQADSIKFHRSAINTYSCRHVYLQDFTKCFMLKARYKLNINFSRHSHHPKAESHQKYAP